MTTEKTTVEQAFREFEEFKKTGFEPAQGVFYDGAMDPLKRMAELLQRDLEADIAAAGGLQAWRSRQEVAHAA